jgi:hypothetical protein
MKSTSSILVIATRVIGPILILLGILLWTGVGSQLLPLHIWLGVLLVLVLWTQAVLAARAGANRGMVAFAFAWGVLMPWFGMAQANVLPGPYHWVIRVLHLVVGIVAMGLIDGLGKQVSRGALSVVELAGAKT